MNDISLVMIPFGDLSKIWKWALNKWWHLPIALTITGIILVLAYLEFFVKNEERKQVLVNWYSQLMGWFGIQETNIIYYLPLVAAFILAVVTFVIIFIILFYFANKSMDEKMNKLRNDKDEEISILKSRVDERDIKIAWQEQAYIHLRHAYKKAEGITTRETSINATTSNVVEDSKEHLQQLGKYELYMKAESLARKAGIPDDA